MTDPDRSPPKPEDVVASIGQEVVDANLLPPSIVNASAMCIGHLGNENEEEGYGQMHVSWINLGLDHWTDQIDPPITLGPLGSFTNVILTVPDKILV